MENNLTSQAYPWTVLQSCLPFQKSLLLSMIFWISIFFKIISSASNYNFFLSQYFSFIFLSLKTATSRIFIILVVTFRILVLFLTFIGILLWGILLFYLILVNVVPLKRTVIQVWNTAHEHTLHMKTIFPHTLLRTLSEL